MALTEEDLSKLPENGIDAENPGKYEDLLEDLQGNILKGHGRDHSVHLFLKFKPNQVDAVRVWIQKIAQSVTSARKQAQEAAEYRRSKQPGETFVNFFLSCKGYEYLGIQPFKIPGDQAFRFGMKADTIKSFLGDPEVTTWDVGLQEEEIHALVLMADDNLVGLLQTVNQASRELFQFAEILHREDGFVLRNHTKETIEHFGFADGVSQPLFLKQDIDKSNFGFDKWDPRAPLKIVLVKDPNGHTEDSYGSYLVYRKLEQDVAAFRGGQKALATKLGIDEALAGAYMVGRFPDGTPVVLSDVPATTSTPTNNFNYNDDPQQFGLTPQPSRCPFHAHIRKTNPRGDTGRIASSPDFQQSLAVEQGHRIARRGVSYGETDYDKDPPPSTGSGLLFMCFQSDISNQFNFMQANWANQNNFAQVNVGSDPIIGVASNGEVNSNVVGNRKWIKTWGEPDTIAEAELFPDPSERFRIWVHLKGGEYFFAPSVSFLKNL